MKTKKLNKWYRDLQRSEKLSAREELAKKIGVSIHTAKSYFTGARFIPSYQMIAVSEFTNGKVSVTDLARDAELITLRSQSNKKAA